MQTKKVQHKELMAKVNNWQKFETMISKRKKISATIMKVGCLEHVKNNPTYMQGLMEYDCKWI